MTIRLRKPLLIAIAALLAGEAHAQSRPLQKKLTGTPPMAFYVARGGPDACGPGCSEWIAADGSIDSTAVVRLRRLLLSLGDRKPPIFFHSNGGSQSQSFAIGHLLRQRGMTAGVSRTVPTGCAKLSASECERLKRSGATLEAELRSVASCGSACVYALIGGVVRLVPPGARVTVHASRLVQLRADGSTVTLRPQASPRYTAMHAELNVQLRAYIKEMGIGDALLPVIVKTPNELAYRLTRDEIVAFGIDTREFQETPWMVFDIAEKEFYVGKLMTRPGGVQGKAYRTSVIQLSCAASDSVKLSLARGLTPDDVGRSAAMNLSIGGGRFDVSQTGQVRGMGWFGTTERFDASWREVPIARFEAAVANGGIELVEGPSLEQSRPSALKLSTQGLLEGIAWLQDRCRTMR